MEKDLKITEAEWKVMEFLWENPSCTMTEIRKNLELTGWNGSTIKTLVTRLIQKGAISAEGAVRHTVYSPAVTIEECQLQETKNFIDRIYNGSVKMMVSNLVKDSTLSKDDAQELMKLIDKMED